MVEQKTEIEVKLGTLFGLKITAFWEGLKYLQLYEKKGD
jgi:hypothetical protein